MHVGQYSPKFRNSRVQMRVKFFILGFMCPAHIRDMLEGVI